MTTSEQSNSFPDKQSEKKEDKFGPLKCGTAMLWDESGDSDSWTASLECSASKLFSSKSKKDST